MNKYPSNLTFLDTVIVEVDEALRAIFARPASSRPNPSDNLAEATLTKPQQADIAGLMRINHTGEVCAQALYRGQMRAATNEATFSLLQQSCIEEMDHLAWTDQRVQELNSHTSYLNPFWYAASFAIGYCTAKVSDGISLGFVEETERQVTRHLDSHLDKIDQLDPRSCAILQQMRLDEIQHGQHAHQAGADELPGGFQFMMQCQSTVMTTVAYYL